MPIASPDRTGTSSKTQPLPVLILEDERFDRHRLARMCSALEFPCEISNATTLEEFSRALEENIFGLILLDYSLPDGTGLEALDMIRLCARNLNAPTLMISGMHDSNIADQAIAAGCREYLTKDALTKTSFGLAVKGALQVDTTTYPSGKDHFERQDVASLLAQNTQTNARDVKPMVSRMMRQLRALRAGAEISDETALQAVEQNCMSLWAYLIEMERLDGETILGNMAIAPRDILPAAQLTSKPRKPPSVFGRTSH